MSPEYSAIDLFAGAGGFSLGMARAGFRVVAAVDNDPQAADAYQRNFPEHLFLERDLCEFAPPDLQKFTGYKTVDCIFGGPPCQGFSGFRVGNHGEGIVWMDDRRNLYRVFLEYVDAFRPGIFVMENVPGIRTAVNGQVFEDIIREMGKLGYEPHHELLRAWRFGIPQKRTRLIIVGFRQDVAPFQGGEFALPTHADIDKPDDQLEKTVDLWEAIGDLPELEAGKSAGEYDLQRRMDFVAEYGDRYMAKVADVYGTLELNAHSARPHIERDLRDFDRLRPGESSVGALKRGVKMEFPNERGEKFKDRYTRQPESGLSSTIVAHLSRDGLMFIHPNQRRSLTPREAARIQSFPDWFPFPVARTHQFRLIGNAVPPLMGEAVGKAAANFLRRAKQSPDSSLARAA